MDREAAPARLNRIRCFNSELAALEPGGVMTLNEGQRLAIAAYHQRLLADLTAQFDLDRDEGQQRMSLGMRIASILGAIALSAAVFLFFYRIWGGLSTTVQVTSHGSSRSNRLTHRQRLTRVRSHSSTESERYGVSGFSRTVRTTMKRLNRREFVRTTTAAGVAAAAAANPLFAHAPTL